MRKWCPDCTRLARERDEVIAEARAALNEAGAPPGEIGERISLLARDRDYWKEQR